MDEFDLRMGLRYIYVLSDPNIEREFFWSCVMASSMKHLSHR